MYYCNQTLRHKVTNELAALIPTPFDTTWKWDIGKNTLMINENGEQFQADINDYTHIKDEFGRPYCKFVKKDEFVDTSAKKYLIPEEDLLKLREQSCIEWGERLLNKMRVDNEIHCPFADGSHCFYFQKWFLEKMEATPLYMRWDTFTKSFVNGLMTFKFEGKDWLYDYQLSELVLIIKP